MSALNSAADDTSAWRGRQPAARTQKRKGRIYRGRGLYIARASRAKNLFDLSEPNHQTVSFWP
jgi:hypothetical protein